VLEVYACSKPVIASRIGFLRELVIQGRTGFLFERGNARELARCLKEILDNPDEAKRMGREARRLAESKFSIGTVTNRLEALYEEVAD
jgi:glycosyltransferase involved in cell wall biosynthesis